MSFITLLSSIAIIIGLCSGLPQLATMQRTRSASGQSALGWLLGAWVNSMMAYVNFAGYHATALSVGNLVSIAICLTAVAMIVRFGPGRGEEPAPVLALATPAAPVAVHAGGIPVSDLATHEFWALRDHLEHEAQRRSSEQQLAAA